MSKKDKTTKAQKAKRAVIVIQAFADVRGLKKTLSSALAQNVVDGWKIDVIVFCQHKGAFSAVAEMEGDFKAFCPRRAGGSASAFNSGIVQAGNADAFIFCDAGDDLDPSHAQRMLDAVGFSDAAAAVPTVELIDEFGIAADDGQHSGAGFCINAAALAACGGFRGLFGFVCRDYIARLVACGIEPTTCDDVTYKAKSRPVHVTSQGGPNASKPDGSECPVNITCAEIVFSRG